jgi:hypothetical protein
MTKFVFIVKVAVGVLLLTIAAFIVIFIGLFTNAIITNASSSRNSEPQMPSAQAAFLSQLEDYRNQYSVVRHNEIQPNRIFEARKLALCEVDSGVRDWIGKVHKIETSLSVRDIGPPWNYGSLTTSGSTSGFVVRPSIQGKTRTCLRQWRI